MRSRLSATAVAALLFLILADRSTRASSGQAPAGAREVAGSDAAPDARKKANEDLKARALERIRGREKEPASQVFKNIQIPWFKDVPAGNLVSIMEGGYSRALGVTCTHCHDANDFSSDAKRPKRAAREMARMHKGINEQLAAMKELETDPEERSINCMVCHQGRLDPRKAG